MLTRRFALSGFIACAAAPAYAQGDRQNLQINWESRSLRRRIAFGEARFGYAGGFQMFEVEARNISSRDQHVEYKIDWFDRDGHSVQTMSTWLRLSLSPRAFEAIHSVGQTASAYSARLTLRNAD